MYYIFYTLAILEKLFTGLKTTASYWTMSGQDDHLSGETFSWPVIFYRMAAQFNMSFRSGPPPFPPPPPHSRDFLRGLWKSFPRGGGGWLCQHLWSLENFWRVCSLKCHTSPPPNPLGESQGKRPENEVGAPGRETFSHPPLPQGLRDGDVWHFRLTGMRKKWAISEGGILC